MGYFPISCVRQCQFPCFHLVFPCLRLQYEHLLQVATYAYKTLFPAHSLIPRIKNWQNPNTCFITPDIGSTVFLRLAYNALPLSVSRNSFISSTTVFISRGKHARRDSVNGNEFYRHSSLSCYSCDILILP